MSHTPPKPKRRHWRWPTAGILLATVTVTVLIVVRGDQRVVGAWIVSPEIPFRDDRLIMRLQPYGVGTFELLEPQTGETKVHDRFRWRIHGDRLYLIGRVDGGPVATAKAVYRNIKERRDDLVTGLPPVVEPSGLVMTIEDNGGLLRFTNTPDSTMCRMK